MSNLENQVWEHKYRPNKIDDVILPESTKKMIKELLASGNVPSFLFSGTQGVGKTTLAKAMAHELGADLLFINASLEGNIDTLRTTITQFVTSVSFTDSKKIVLLDEGDHLNPQSTQPAMRGFLDEFSKNTIFIITCNYKHKIIAPLQSRLTNVDFTFSKEEKQGALVKMLKRTCGILDTENVKYDKKVLAAIITRNFPDFRKTLVELQRYSSSGEIDSGILAGQDSDITEFIECLKKKSFNEGRKWIATNTMDPSVFYRALYDKLLPELVPQTVPQMILYINQYQTEATMSIDQEISQAAFLVNAMSTVQFK